ncbi:MAG: ABC transporter permease, partial [Clostridia bacterium]|nr:ABC transporter permease [Clostridia bacterium]
MLNNLIAWLLRAIPFGTIIMYGSMGETITEKSGNLNLGVPGIMYLGAYAGYLSAYLYENNVANPSALVCVLLSLFCAFLASALGGLIFSFLTITLRANQNVTGLALTTFGMGVANFFGALMLKGEVYTAAPVTNAAFTAKIPGLSAIPVVGEALFSYG